MVTFCRKIGQRLDSNIEAEGASGDGLIITVVVEGRGAVKACVRRDEGQVFREVFTQSRLDQSMAGRVRSAHPANVMSQQAVINEPRSSGLHRYGSVPVDDVFGLPQGVMERARCSKEA